ncbi:MAG: DUF1592 domain-containing protein [Nannocystales bacterium]
MRRGAILTAVLGTTGCYSGATVDASAVGETSAGFDDGGSGGETDDAGGDGSDDSGTDDPAAEPTELSRWRRLTASQYANSIEVLLGTRPDIESFIADTAPGDSPFPANAGIAPQSVDIDIYWQSALALAEEVTAEPSGLFDGCDPVTDGEDTCVDGFIDSFGARAFRRPLTEPQRNALRGLFDQGAEQNLERGLQMVIEAVLQSPNFLYIVEFGLDAGPDGRAELDGYELATRLAFFLTDATPDPALLSDAESLHDPEVLLSHAERLMQTEAFLAALVEAHLHLTHISRIDNVSRAETEFDDELRDSMKTEARSFLEEVLTDPGTVEGLFVTPLAFPDERLAADIYGFGGTGEGMLVDDGSRAGLLTLPAFLASSPPIESDFEPVYRGNAVRARLLCDTLPPPTVDTNFPDAGDLSPRERLRQHQEDPSCAGCHVLMDNIGFGLLNYDDLGRFSQADAFGPIDASGYVLSDGEVEFGDVQEMAEVLSTLPQVRDCMATQLFRLATAREPDEADNTSLAPVHDALSEDGGDIRKAITQLVLSESFRTRRGD